MPLITSPGVFNWRCTVLLQHFATCHDVVLPPVEYCSYKCPTCRMTMTRVLGQVWSFPNLVERWRIWYQQSSPILSIFCCPNAIAIGDEFASPVVNISQPRLLMSASGPLTVRPLSPEWLYAPEFLVVWWHGQTKCDFLLRATSISGS